MQHIFAVTEKQLDIINLIMRNKCEGEFCILSYGGSFCDIAQWSDKYQNVKILSVPTIKLDMSMCVHQ